MTLNAERLEKLLAPRPVRYFDQIQSTNDSARQWLHEGALEGAVVIADEQLRGRGRLGRGWQTPAGTALAVSLILRPSPDDLSRLSILGALAVAELSESLGAPYVSIKWPNDVQIAGRKVSGILPEVEWRGDQLLGAALGMGVNVRVDFSGTALEGSAISLEMAVGRPLDRGQLVKYLLDRVQVWYERLGSEVLFEAWRSRLSTPGKAVNVGEVFGIAEDVDESGALLIRDASGVLHRVMAGDLDMGVRHL